MFLNRASIACTDRICLAPRDTLSWDADSMVKCYASTRNKESFGGITVSRKARTVQLKTEVISRSATEAWDQNDQVAF